MPFTDFHHGGGSQWNEWHLLVVQCLDKRSSKFFKNTLQQKKEKQLLYQLLEALCLWSTMETSDFVVETFSKTFIVGFRIVLNAMKSPHCFFMCWKRGWSEEEAELVSEWRNGVIEKNWSIKTTETQTTLYYNYGSKQWQFLDCNMPMTVRLK